MKWKRCKLKFKKCNLSKIIKKNSIDFNLKMCNWFKYYTLIWFEVDKRTNLLKIKEKHATTLKKCY